MNTKEKAGKNALHINDTFAIDWDRYQWILYYWPNNKFNENGEFKGCTSNNTHYFPRLKQVAEFMVRISLEHEGTAQHLHELEGKIDKLIQKQEECLEIFGLKMVQPGDNNES